MMANYYTINELISNAQTPLTPNTIMQIAKQLEIISNKHEKHREHCCTTFLQPKKDITLPMTNDIEIIKENVGSQNITMDYLIALLKEKKQLMVFPQFFANVDRLLDEEISRVRMSLFQCDFSNIELDLPEPEGDITIFYEKIYVPVNDFPEYNFVGRILGPRGMTAKQLEQETGCKIMVRGKGSMRDRKKEEANYGKPNWEHLEEDLHVLIHCEDTPNRAKIKIKNAMMQVDKLLIPAPEGSDELKRKQLMELAIINGTYRPSTNHKYPITSPRLLPPLNILPSVHDGSSRTMSCPMYSNSQFFPSSPIGGSPLSAALTDRGGSSSPVPQTCFDYNSSTLDNLFQQIGINGFGNAFLTGGYPTTPSVFNTPTHNETFSYFYDSKNKPQPSLPRSRQRTDNSSESSDCSIKNLH